MGVTPEYALEVSLRGSLIAKTAFVDGEIAAMYGVGGVALSAVGEPWLLTAPVIERIPVSFVKECRRGLVTWLDIFPRLEGYVDASYGKACGLLAMLGFTLSEPIPLGPQAAPFRRYERSR